METSKKIIYLADSCLAIPVLSSANSCQLNKQIFKDYSTNCFDICVVHFPHPNEANII